MKYQSEFTNAAPAASTWQHKPSALPMLWAGVLKITLVVLAWSCSATATGIEFGVDPFEGTTVRRTPGRQVVGGEFFAAFRAATETFIFDNAAFRMGNEIHFANGRANEIPSTGLNAIVLQDLDNDANPLTPFGAGNAADLLADRITTHAPGVFIYFNSSLQMLRLVYSDDLASHNADLRILARLLNLTGQQGINALPTFTASNFAISGSQATPEPSTMALMCGGGALLMLRTLRRRARR